MQFVKRNLPVIFAFLAGVLLWAQYFVPSRASAQLLDVYTNYWITIMFATALILGILSALHYHVSKIQNKRAGFGYSIITLTVFMVMTIIGLFPIKIPGFAAVSSNPDSLYQWMFDYLYTPLAATMFSTLAFFIASAAFRAFRARSLEATALLVAGCIVMLGRVSIGEKIPIWPALGGGEALHLNDLSGWIFNSLNTAGQTGILIGIILSQVAISLRVIFGIERTYMGGGD